MNFVLPFLNHSHYTQLFSTSRYTVYGDSASDINVSGSEHQVPPSNGPRLLHQHSSPAAVTTITTSAMTSHAPFAIGHAHSISMPAERTAAAGCADDARRNSSHASPPSLPPPPTPALHLNVAEYRTHSPQDRGVDLTPIDCSTPVDNCLEFAESVRRYSLSSPLVIGNVTPSGRYRRLAHNRRSSAILANSPVTSNSTTPGSSARSRVADPLARRLGLACSTSTLPTSSHAPRRDLDPRDRGTLTRCESLMQGNTPPRVLQVSKSSSSVDIRPELPRRYYGPEVELLRSTNE